MSHYHATAISLVSRCCPYALELQERGVPYARDVFGVGIAAHAVLEAAQCCTNELKRQLTDEEVKASALGVCERLISVGRSYDSHPEPPMKPDDVFAGQELALDWVLGVEPCQPGAMVEQGIGLDANGLPCDYWKGDGLTIRTILDHVRIVREEDEETARTVLVVRDFKSAWSADEGELDTLQRKIQAIAAWRTYGPVDALRLEVVNLRLQKIYSRELYAEDGLEAQIGEWWSAVAATARALDAQKKLGPRPAAPGVGCSGCPFVLNCQHAYNFYEMRGEFGTAEKKATAYCVVSAMRDALAEELRQATDEDPIQVNGGEVGYFAKDRKKLRDDGYQTLWERWSEQGGEVLGFTKALKLGSGNATAMAKALYFDRKAKAEPEALIEEVTEPDTVREFGFQKPEKA